MILARPCCAPLMESKESSITVNLAHRHTQAAFCTLHQGSVVHHGTAGKLSYFADLLRFLDSLKEKEIWLRLKGAKFL